MKMLTLALGLMTVVFCVAACGGVGAGNTPAKPRIILRKPVPPEFKDAKSPEGFDLSAKVNIDSGKAVFEAVLADGGGNCFSCHGTTGKGDGPQSAGLDPKPTDLTSAEFQTGVKDDYVYWRVKKGGEGGPVGTAMTGFMGEHPEEKYWQVVAYVRSLKSK